MAKRRIHGNILITNQTRADQFLAQINTHVQSLSVFRIDHAVEKYFDSDTGTLLGIWFQIRFDTDIIANDLRDFITNRWAIGPIGNTVLAGSRLALHTCSHDEIGNWRSCVEDEILVK